MKTAILGLLAFAAAGATGFSWSRTRSGSEALPYSKVCVTHDASGNACGEKEHFFDEHGNLVKVVERLGPVSPGFYNTDLMVKPVGPDGKAFTFQYDKGCTYGDTYDAEGRRMEYRYDAQGNLASVADDQGRIQMSFVYDDQGRLVSVTDAQAPFRYDPSAQLIAVREDDHATR